MANNKKEKLLSNNLIQKFLENDNKLLLDKDDKFFEIASSLAYYLKSFSNIKRFLDYIALILKHTFNQQLFLIIPLNENSDIWKIIRKYKSDTFDVKNPFSYKINMRLPSIHGPFNPNKHTKWALRLGGVFDKTAPIFR